MAEYQSINTQLWDLIRDTVTIAGEWEEIDAEHIQGTFINGELRDGAGFNQWVISHGDITTLTAQLKIETDYVNFQQLDTAVGCSVQRVTLHLTRLHRLWRKRATTNTDKADEFILNG